MTSKRRQVMRQSSGATSVQRRDDATVWALSCHSSWQQLIKIVLTEYSSRVNNCFRHVCATNHLYIRHTTPRRDVPTYVEPYKSAVTATGLVYSRWSLRQWLSTRRSVHISAWLIDKLILSRSLSQKAPRAMTCSWLMFNSTIYKVWQQCVAHVASSQTHAR